MTTMSEEDYEDPNEGLRDCHTCYHALKLHTNEVGCGAIPQACTVKDCCKHKFPTVAAFRKCVHCGEKLRRLSLCGHYHREGETCDVNEALQTAKWRDEASPIMTVPENAETFTLEPKRPRIQLHIILLNGGHLYFPEPWTGWKVDAASRCIIVGKGVPRYHIPLENVAYFGPEGY
jgi:hypothetical protein